jgi:meso-butanediol dehydrogenase / (S,S)-butanediol dehydrogenase / diacetyl reductase
MARCIAITGAGSGLGRALARRIATDGDSVILLGRNRGSLDAVAAELSNAHAMVCDVGSADSVRAAFAMIAKQHSKLDVLINNAAIYQPFTVREATDLQINAALTTNFVGPIYCSRAAIPMMRKGSHIINISSESVRLPHAMFSLYQSSKAGLERFTEAMHAELEPEGIRVTMVRAGQMMDADSRSPTTDAGVRRRFAEENLKRGLDFRTRPISSFESVAEVLCMLLRLPGDVNVPRIMLEARLR